MNNQYKAVIIRSLAIFFALCAVVGILSRSKLLRGKETLAEHAEKVALEEIPSDVSENASEANIQAESVRSDISSSDDVTYEFEPCDVASDDTSENASDVSNNSDSEKVDSDNEEVKSNTVITTYADGFYYETLSDEMKNYITGTSFPADCENIQISYDDLRLVHLNYVNFHGVTHEGLMICNASIADDITEIFYELYQADYQIEKICLIDEYGGDDTLSMEDNNTSCFNYRNVDNSTNLSKHALGLAIDLNPFYNPYVTYPNGGIRISPSGSEQYADRGNDFPYKIDENDLAYKLFTEHGFIWGGNWNSLKDYQHFQKNPK